MDPMSPGMPGGGMPPPPTPGGPPPMGGPVSPAGGPPVPAKQTQPIGIPILIKEGDVLEIYEEEKIKRSI